MSVCEVEVLLAALRKGKLSDHVDIASVIDACLNVSAINQHIKGVTLLSHAVLLGNLTAVQVLVAKGSNINTYSKIYDDVRHVWREEPPLITATRLGMLDMVRYLLDIGAAVELADVEIGKSPLHWACARGHMDIARLLMSCNADVNKRDYYWETPTVEAIGGRLPLLVETLVYGGVKLDEYLTYERDTALSFSFITNQPRISTFLVRAGADVNKLNRESEDALYICLSNHASSEQAMKSCELLFRAGAKIRPAHIDCSELHRGKDLNVLLLTVYMEGRNSPPSLRQQTRLSIRRYLMQVGGGTHILDRVGQLPLPRIIQSYLKLEM